MKITEDIKKYNIKSGKEITKILPYHRPAILSFFSSANGCNQDDRIHKQASDCEIDMTGPELLSLQGLSAGTLPFLACHVSSGTNYA